MKRSCFTGLLLSAALFASEIRAPGQTNVYSLDVVSYVNVGMEGLHASGPTYHLIWPPALHASGPGFQQIWSAANLAVSKVTCWTDASGRDIEVDPSRPNEPGDTSHSHTEVQIGPAFFSIPLAPRSVGIVATTIAAIFLTWDRLVSRKRKHGVAF